MPSHFREDVMKEFQIPFFGLKIGKHEFEFKLGKPFFEAFDTSEFEEGDIIVDLELDKLSSMLVLDFTFKGSVTVPCDRCGADLTIDVGGLDHWIVKYGEEDYEDTDDILVVSPTTHEIDVMQRIYEMVILNLPNKRAHQNLSDCDQVVIAKLKTYQTAEEETDPRWNALKKLK